VVPGPSLSSSASRKFRSCPSEKSGRCRPRCSTRSARS